MLGAILGIWLTAAAFAQEPPPEVEPGSVREVYVVKPGDTLRTIADAHAFLVDDLVRWNNLKDADKITPGQELVMWVAPPVAVTGPATVGAPADAPKDEKAAKAEKPPKPAHDADDGIGGFVGLQVGPAIALNPLSPAFLPRLEGGIELPAWERRLRIFVAGTWSRPSEEGTASDPRVAGGDWSYRLEQSDVTGAAGLTVRVAPEAKVIPEISGGPAVWWHRSVADGEAGGSAFGKSAESYTRIGAFAAVGAALPLGPGELDGQLAFTGTGFGGRVTGQASDLAITPLVGYRLVF